MPHACVSLGFPLIFSFLCLVFTLPFFSLSSSLSLSFTIAAFRILFLFFHFWGSMVGRSEVRTLCPSISFLFTRLRAFLGISRTFCHLVEGFVFGGSSLSVVLANLFPLLRQSVDWFKELVGEWRVMSELRSSELEMSLSSSDDPVKEETAAFGLKEVRAFSALEEECGLDAKTLFRFQDRF